jgi:hypothetical protein
MLTGGAVVVSLDANGGPVVVGTGLAVQWAHATVTAALAQLPPLPQVGGTAPPYRPEAPATTADRALALKARQLLFEDKARDANAIAPILIAYLKANAEVDLSPVTAKVENVSVGRTPNPLAADTPIRAPQSPVYLPLAGTARIS